MVFDNVEGKTRCLTVRNTEDPTETPVMSTSYRLCRTVADRNRAAPCRSASTGCGRRIGTETPIPFASSPAFRFVASSCLLSRSPDASASGLLSIRH